MKKKIDKISDDAVGQLADIGQLIRQHRKSFKITANATGETAGISRVTLHRIEKGDPTVSMGAYLNFISLKRAMQGVIQTGARWVSYLFVSC